MRSVCHEILIRIVIHLTLLLPYFSVRYARIRRIQDMLEGTPKPVNQYIQMDIRIRWVTEGLALCFLHMTSRRAQPCGAPALNQQQIATLSYRLQAALGVPRMRFPKRIFHIVSYRGGVPTLGMVWPPDTAERDDGPWLLDAFDAVPPHAPPSCKETYRFKGLLTIVGDCESNIIKYGAAVAFLFSFSNVWSDFLFFFDILGYIAFAYHTKTGDMRKTSLRP